MARYGQPASIYPPAVANTLRRSQAADAAPYGSIASRDDPSNYGSTFQQLMPSLADPASANLSNTTAAPSGVARSLRRGKPAQVAAAPTTLAAPDLFSYFMRQQAARQQPALNFNDDQ